MDVISAVGEEARLPSRVMEEADRNQHLRLAERHGSGSRLDHGPQYFDGMNVDLVGAERKHPSAILLSRLTYLSWYIPLT